MDLKQQILHLYRVDKLSLREIARRTGADRKTVTRLINAYEAAVKAMDILHAYCKAERIDSQTHRRIGF